MSVAPDSTIDLTAFARQLGSRLTGRVSTPGDQAYETAVDVWAKPTLRPALVAHCLTETDVATVVLAAQQAGLRLSVRGGGHDLAGRALCDGLTLDLSAMNAVGPINSDDSIEVGGGATGNDVYDVTDPAGLAPVLGAVADVGIAGMLTGGGYGTLLRRFGMACDNLLAATVVLADGSVVRTDRHCHPELFWALKGGGGNFGVITSLKLALHPVGTVRSGLMLFPLAGGEDVLGRLGQIWAAAPAELDVQVGIIPGPADEPVIYLSPTWSGDPGRASSALAPLLAIDGCMLSTVHDQPFGQSRRFYDEHIVRGLQVSGDTLWLKAWNDETTRIVLDAMRRRPSPLCVILCHEFSGAATEPAPSDTAFAMRQPHIWFEAIAPTDPGSDSDGTAEAQWVREVVEALAGHGFPGAYPNMLEADQARRAEAGFGENSARLRDAKRVYDPNDVFRSTIDLHA